MTEFRMPSLGADMEVGKLVHWKVKAGDRVKRGDIIAEVETEKANIDVEVFTNGVVHELLVEPGTKAPVGTVLATIVEEGKASPPVPPAVPAAAAVSERVRVSPLARKLAAELGVDLTSLHGTGVAGAVTRADIERAAAAVRVAKPTPVLPAADSMSGMRRAIAAAMSRSNREIPHYYLETTIDMQRPLEWMRSENQKRAVKDRLLPVAVLVRAVVKALGEVPELNGYWVDDHLETKASINIGFAIAMRKGGLMTPALLQTETKSVDQLMDAITDLIERAREGHLRSSEMTEGTITVTSLGDLGVDTVFGVIYPPQVALIGFGKIEDRPWALDGMLGVRPLLSATLAGDHRATDGRRGAQFLDALRRYLGEPEKL